MTRMIKVFATAQEQTTLDAFGQVIANYDAFAVLEMQRARAAQLASRFPCEDITELYRLPIAGRFVIPPTKSLGTTSASTKSAAKGQRTLLAATRMPSQGMHHQLVQFVGPVKSQWLSGIRRAGGDTRELYRDFTYVVRADATTMQRIAALPYVRWVGHLPHEARLSSSLRKQLAGEPAATLPRTKLRDGVYTVQVFDKRLLTAITRAAQQLGFDVLSRSAEARTLVVSLDGTLTQRRRKLATLSTVHGVKYIRARALKRASNDVATPLMGAVEVQKAPLGLTGRGEIVAICDTGLDSGDPDNMHPDFAGRVLAIRSYPIAKEFAHAVFNPGADDGPADTDSGHGTHVAGSAVGDGRASEGKAKRKVRGLAYQAQLVFQAVEQQMWWRPEVPPSQRRERYALAGLTTNLTAIFSWAYAQGARIHSNSWGGGGPGDYDEQSEQLDRFVWTHKDMVILVAAGNDGTDRDADGRINAKSVTSPATAKNCISIGASESWRPQFNGDTYGHELWWAKDYPVAPFRRDPMADDPEQVAAFSSRGPTDDGRIKPDLVAPGTYILSTRSSLLASNNHGWAPWEASRDYFYMGGTSMATPLAAGAATVVREYLRRKRRMTTPSAALVKAVLIAGARRLHNRGLNAELSVDNEQGYGAIDLAVALKSSTVLFDEGEGLATGQAWSRSVKVKAGIKQLRVALVYSDYPGPSLVNNLNLILTAPDGKKWTSLSAVNGTLALDNTNNTELVVVSQPTAGRWRLDVFGANVPQGPQDFALVALGAQAV